MTEKTCFIIGPIGDEGSEIRRHADWVLDGIINPVLKALDMPLGVRSDRITSPGMIDSQVINHVLDADLVIADLTLRNPNVFYELGLRHREEKPIIHLVHKSELKQLPFDVAPYRTVPVSWDTPQEVEQSKHQLREQVQAAIAEGHEVENPVTRARVRQRLKETASSTEKLLLDEMQGISARVAELEKARPVRQMVTTDGFPPDTFIPISAGPRSSTHHAIPLTLLDPSKLGKSYVRNFNGKRAVLSLSGLGTVTVSVEGDENVQLSLNEWNSLPIWDGP